MRIQSGHVEIAEREALLVRKMRLQLVSTGFSSAAGVGPERYASELLQGVSGREGLEVVPVSSPLPRVRFALAVNSIAPLPWKVLSRLQRVDLIHALDPSSALALPFTGRLTVATFHDLLPLLLRNSYYGVGDRVFSLFAYRIASRCDLLVAVSEQTKSEVSKYLSISPNKIRVISHGVADHFRVLPTGKDRSLIGYVGDINPRKRVDFLLEGFAILKRRYLREARLVVVGTPVAQFLRDERVRLSERASEEGLSDSVSFTGRVTEERLVELYNRMSVLVLPSDYEGFGFPIVESERCGTPVIVRDGARISSEVSTACLKVGSPDELAQTIFELLTNSELYEMRQRLAREHAARFTWGRCIDQTLSLYQELAG